MTNPRRRLLNEVAVALQQIKDELPTLSDQNLLYFPDFNLIHPFIYQESASRYRYTDIFGSSTFRIIENTPSIEGLRICISLPTMLEFIFSIQQHHDFITNQIHNQEFGRYTFDCLAQLRAGSMNIKDVNSAYIKRFILQDLDTNLLDIRISNFISLMAQGKIDLLTDFYSASDINRLLSSRRALLEQLHQRIVTDRIRSDPRRDISRIMSYKVDAHNIFLPLLNELDESRKLNFVCSNRFYHWAGDNRVLYDHQRSALFLLSLVALINKFPNFVSVSERIRQIDSVVSDSIKQAVELMDYDVDTKFDLGLTLRFDAFIRSNIDAYVEMAHQSAAEPVAESDGAPQALNYRNYLEMLDMRRTSLRSRMTQIHNLIDDSTDDMYRDFVDDDRLKGAFPALNLRY